MDPLLLNKLLKFCGYDNLNHSTLQNPLLELEVASALSKSLVKILKISNAPSTGSAVKKNLKKSVVENVRNLCRCCQACSEHKNVLENALNIYHLKYSSSDNPNDNALIDIEVFLSSENMRLSTKLGDEFVNDTILAILNINSHHYLMNNVLEQLVMRNISSLNQNIVIKLWHRKHFSPATYDLLSVLMIPSIENILQEYCLKVLSSDTVEYDDEEFVNLISTMSNQIIKKDLLSMFMAAVKAVQAENLIKQNVKVNGNILHIRENKFDLKENNVYMVGIGKAAQNMAKEMERQLGDHLKKGIVSIPKNSLIEECITGKVRYLEGGKSNLPDQDAVNNTIAITNLAKSLIKDDLLIVLISGGGSALLSLPENPITLEIKLDIINKLASNGADIKELNSVRKRISAVKGGKLAIMAYPATVISLILSDIVGDPVDFIASAPTEFNKDPKEKAIMILEKYNLFNELSKDVKNVISKDQTDIDFPHSVKNLIIGSNKVSLHAAKNKAEELGYAAIIVSSKLTGCVTDVAKIFVRIVELINNGNFSTLNEYFTNQFDEYDSLVTGEAIHDSGLCFIFGGETTVNVKGNGVGGRNQHLALEFAKTIREHAENLKKLDINLLCAGTDGIDGPTDAAGAVVYKDLVKDATLQELCIKDYLANSDSYNFFKRFRNGDLHIKCGHTQTNVMDVNILMIKIK